MSAGDECARARSFGAAAADYDRLRPAPAPAALAWLLAAAPGSATVLDLGAGTGLLARAVRECGPTVVAVEPDERMRALLTTAAPDVAVHAGTAEAIPLPPASVDAVLVASAWHWFDAGRATAEIARVLRPGGTLGLLWSYADPEVEWVHELRTLAHPESAHPDGAAGSGRVRDVGLPADAPFTPGERRVFPRTGSMSRDDLADMITTYSRVMALPAEERADVRARARAILDGRPELGSDDPVAVPFTTLCWRATRR